MNQQKRVLAINDISCFGKCSLTVALPILSAAGIETCVLPTAVLSAHTAFPDYTFCDLTENMLPQATHWEKLGLTFSGIYSGYLGSIRQVAIVEEIISRFPSDFVLVDPVMGDNGALYAGFDYAFVAEMKRLVKKAGVIVPNMTEAAFLADVPYEPVHTDAYVETVAERLKSLADGNIVITGVEKALGMVATAVVHKQNISYIEREKFDAFYSGSGDVFASTLAGAMINGAPLDDAAELATDFVIACMRETKRTSGSRNYGLNFEACMGNLIDKLNQKQG